VANLVDKVVKELGTVDIPANNAGISIYVPFRDTTREIYDKVMDANLRSQFICCQEVSKVMIEQKSGVIINWISLSAYKIGRAYVYGMAKIGATALTGWVAQELAQYNIRVNGIAPGLVRTDLGPHGIHTVPVTDRLNLTICEGCFRWGELPSPRISPMLPYSWPHTYPVILQDRLLLSTAAQ